MSIQSISRVLTILALIAMPLMTVACNTMEGVGEDVQAGGEKLENSAEKNKSY